MRYVLPEPGHHGLGAGGEVLDVAPLANDEPVLEQGASVQHQAHKAVQLDGRHVLAGGNLLGQRGEDVDLPEGEEDEEGQPSRHGILGDGEADPADKDGQAGREIGGEDEAEEAPLGDDLEAGDGVERHHLALFVFGLHNAFLVLETLQLDLDGERPLRLQRMKVVSVVDHLLAGGAVAAHEKGALLPVHWVVLEEEGAPNGDTRLEAVMDGGVVEDPEYGQPLHNVGKVKLLQVVDGKVRDPDDAYHILVHYLPFRSGLVVPVVDPDAPVFPLDGDLELHGDGVVAVADVLKVVEEEPDEDGVVWLRRGQPLVALLHAEGEGRLLPGAALGKSFIP